LSSILVFVLGAVFGALLAFASGYIVRRISGRESANVMEQMEKVFKAASYDLSKQSIEEILKVSREILESKTSEGAADLESKKKLIDQSLTNISRDMQERLEKVQKLMSDINQAVPEKYGQVSKSMEQIAKQADELRQTTESLNRALSSTQVRGQWGERMAEDILRIVGMQENINYIKQKSVGSGTRPDFTFLLPNELKVNMDVKFPFEKYKAFLDAESDAERNQAQKLFLNSVKDRIKEVTGRDYINPEENTVEYVVVFIPKERIYTFIQEADSSILDDALKQKVILCSPLTLYAMLALMRQAIDNFNLRQSSREIQALLGGFSKQWGMFVDSMKTVGSRIESAGKAFDEMIGVRKRMLDRQVRKIDELNRAEGVEPKVLEANDDTPEIEDKTESDEDDLLM
jgi:DNA recombination protein RmuC